MSVFLTMTLAGLLASAQPTVQDDPAGLFNNGFANNFQPVLLALGPDDRQDRRQERGRSDERQDKRDCRQEEGAVGKDKRDCKQEEVRDGVRGNQGDKEDGQKDQDDKD
jgi:hypothetical protein